MHRTKSGEIRNVHVSVKTLHLDDRVLAYSIFQDITESKQAEQKYKNILLTAIDGFWTIDARGRLVDVNEAYCRMSGYGRDELLTMRISDLEIVETPDDIGKHLTALSWSKAFGFRP